MDIKTKYLIRSTIYSCILYLSKVFMKLSLIAWLIWFIKEILLGLCRSKKRLDGKIILLTGGDSGIGYEVAKNLSTRGAILIMAAKNIKKLQIARDKIAKFSGNEKILAMKLDLSSFQSVIEFSTEFKEIFNKIDYIINNAGIGVNLGSSFLGPKVISKKVYTPDGFEVMMQTNYISPFLLFDLLNDLLKDNSRLINVIHPFYLLAKLNANIDLNMEETKYNPDVQFGNSKLALALFGQEMARCHGIKSINVIPGLCVRSHFYSHSHPLCRRILKFFAYFLGKNQWQASQSVVQSCLMSDQSLQASSNPRVINDCRFSSFFWIHQKLKDEKLAKTLYDKTVDLLNQCQ
ncbi:retinol dehydrogenase 11 [Lepeophtheirus salmonis]|uniref:retinol dehydrogenase 11 n=1 Tax=Lepeophtheirus salmonis TaxID=72036 RepID=UPI001AE9A94D|nr:retinol dehydrogenase 11-like [Lepeophtheirus salmonis]